MAEMLQYALTSVLLNDTALESTFQIAADLRCDLREQCLELQRLYTNHIKDLKIRDMPRKIQVGGRPGWKPPHSAITQRVDEALRRRVAFAKKRLFGH